MSSASSVPGGVGRTCSIEGPRSCPPDRSKRSARRHRRQSSPSRARRMETRCWRSLSLRAVHGLTYLRNKRLMRAHHSRPSLARGLQNGHWSFERRVLFEDIAWSGHVIKDDRHAEAGRGDQNEPRGGARRPWPALGSPSDTRGLDLRFPMPAHARDVYTAVLTVRLAPNDRCPMAWPLPKARFLGLNRARMRAPWPSR